MNGISELRKTKRTVRNQYKLNLEVPIMNQVTFAAKSIGYLGPKNLEFTSISHKVLQLLKEL